MLKTLPELIASARANITTVKAAEALPVCYSQNALLIDVREPNEYATAAISKAINIPRGVLEMQMINLYPDENTNIYIHCATGGRASLAAEQLLRVGYKNVTAISCNLDEITKTEKTLSV